MLFCKILSLFVSWVEPYWQLLQQAIDLCFCGWVQLCRQEFMDDGCCEIQWKSKWKRNCSMSACTWAKIFLLCGYGNINVNTCTISLSLHFITSTHLLLSRPHRCSLIPFKVFHWCGKPLSLTFSHRVSYSLSPWPLASFTTHINTQLPPGNAVPDPRHHLKVANLSPW